MPVQGRRTLVLGRRAASHATKMFKKLAERNVRPTRLARAHRAMEKAK